MDILQARLDSFKPAKRTKNGPKKSIKWPHPSTHEATPTTLAEAGFYFDPSPDDEDNVTCFMCGKELSSWDAEDDPFVIHWEKCRTSCAWAAARCGVGMDGSFDISDPDRHPGSKLQEKARIETFNIIGSWPHDSSKGHGANSKKMAKAGFVYTPQSIGDDTATCVYCHLALSGWVANDDPKEEHLKREKKTGNPCPFFQPLPRNLGKSTSKPPSRPASKPPSRTASQTRSKAAEVAEPINVDDSEDELAVAPASLAKSTRSKSAASRASTVKTPASRRSTRTGTSGKTPGSRAATASEAEDTEGEGGGSDAGKRVSQTKRKAQTKAKDRIAVIEEEVEDPPRSESIEETEVEVEVAVENPKKGRPLKNATKAKPQAKKPQLTKEEDVEEEDVKPNLEPANKGKGHSRVRSRVVTDGESDAGPSSSKSGESRTRSASKSKSSEQQMTAPELQGSGAGSNKRSGKKPKVEDQEFSNEMPPPPPPAAKVSRSKTKAVTSTSSDDTLSLVEQPTHSDPRPVQASQSKAPRDPAPTSRIKQKQRQSITSGSDEAGYVTPSASVEPNMMELDHSPDFVAVPEDTTAKPQVHAEEPATRSQFEVAEASIQKKKSDTDMVAQSVRPPSSSGSSSRASVKPPSTSKVTRTGVGSLSRTSSATDTSIRSTRMSRDKMKVVEIPSDEEAEHAAPPPAVKKTQAGRHKQPSPPHAQPPPVISNDLQQSNPFQTEDVAMTESRPPDIPIFPVDHVLDGPPTVTLNGNAVPVPGPSTPVRSVRQLSPIPQSAPSSQFAREQELPESGDGVYTPSLATEPFHRIASLTEEERAMTVEQYVRREIALQYQQFKEDAERRIMQFKERAAETRRIAEAV